MCRSCLASFGVVESNIEWKRTEITLLINSFDCSRETELLQGRLEHLRFHHGDRQHRGRPRDRVRGT